MAVGISPLELAAFAWSSSASSSSSCSLDPCPSRRISQRNLYVRAAKRRRNARKGPQQNARLDLSRILRTEAAVLGVERKAGSAKFTRLWPRAVLEALDNSISANQWESALKGFCILQIFGLVRRQHWYQPISRTYARLLTMLGKCRQPDHATSLFRVMLSEGLKPTLDVYTSLVGAYGHSGLLDKAISTLEEMNAISDCEPDAHTYTVLISSCCKLRRFELIPQLLMEMSYLGIEPNTVTHNTIIDGYGKARMLEEMESHLSTMLETGKCLPDIYTMNSFVWAYGNNGRIEDMEKWYDEFQHMGIEPDIQTFNILIKSYGKVAMFEKMGLVMNFMKKRFFSPDTVTFNIIIACFGRVGNIEKMEYYFRLMKIQGVKPNSVTYCSVISGYNKAGLLEKVPAIVRQTENTDVVLDAPFFNSVIAAYGQARELKIMEEMFALMKEKNCVPDSVTFATMIRAYSDMGMHEVSKKLEDQMYALESKGEECAPSRLHESEPTRFANALTTRTT
ncbi:pentatricopeptide repeat-containing protein At3g53170-like isoform X1 [Zingiber officinale]|uniref:pentatricopeptide repeat-containing protein At3g53170-like isoform X1 n=1 Tax=Zingiber officinale TaxID=94328 RepID=UPI001C4C75C8|nr:pentatricopeptide repeat-containing protein At3g53170-like isoform X1 [Zingiber officinale]